MSMGDWSKFFLEWAEIDENTMIIDPKAEMRQWKALDNTISLGEPGPGIEFKGMMLDLQGKSEEK